MKKIERQKSTHPAFRDYTLQAAIHNIVSELEVGESVEIEKISGIDGSEDENNQTLKSCLHRIKLKAGIVCRTKGKEQSCIILRVE